MEFDNYHGDDRFKKGDFISRIDGNPYSCGNYSVEIKEVTEFTYVIGDGRRIPKEYGAGGISAKHQKTNHLLM